MADGDSSDDDLPLAEIIRRKEEKAKKAAAATQSNKRKKTEDASENEDEDEDEDEEDDEEDDDDDDAEEDSDEDVPISEIIGKAKKKKKEEDSDDEIVVSPVKKKKETALPVKRKASTTTKKTVKKASNRESAFYETERGKLLQNFLRRWWYVVDWPGPEAATRPPEKDFEQLPGFPGVHICTAGERLGELQDHRDHNECPSFHNYYKRSTADLKKLVLAAFDKQIEELQEVDPRSPMINALKQDRAACARVDTKKADAEANKAIKTYDAHAWW